jgi:hypothetical protein
VRFRRLGFQAITLALILSFMNGVRLSFAQVLVCALLLGGDLGRAQALPPAIDAFVGWATNGPAVYRLYVGQIQVMPGPPVSYDPPPLDLPVEIRSTLMTFRAASNLSYVTNTIRGFDHFLPESLNNVVWTNFIAHTNGRSMAIWTERTRTPLWPSKPARVGWNPNSLLWGMKGLTAICPCWQGEGPPGWIPITALTRRHGYLLGHGMQKDGVSGEFAGKKVWFLTTHNQIVERTIVRQLSRLRQVSNRDYTIVIFDSDLPETIEPMRVARLEEVLGPLPTKYLWCTGAPFVFFKTEQKGNVSAEVPGFTVDTMKGGDSGSPNMLPLPGELVFRDGRTTSPPSPEMQADMDQLCRLQGLDPAGYQLQYADLTAYPSYLTVY